ncbi:MAG: hypothetical protein JXR53_06065 [Bacteroidales bacterium]|nr:hypothetical protein [Bacteroidales bacterium]
MATEKNSKNILDYIDSVELEMLRDDIEYTKKYLEEEGVNIVEEQDYAGRYMKKVKFMAKAISNKNQEQSLLEKAFKIVRKSIEENAQKTTETLISLLQSKTPSFQYRKLEEWSDEEIRDVLTDVDLVKLMEELDKD